MKEDRRPQEICAIWIDHTNRIISFRKEDGFEPAPFSHQMNKCSMHWKNAPTAAGSNDRL